MVVLSILSPFFCKNTCLLHQFYEWNCRCFFFFEKSNQNETIGYFQHNFHSNEVLLHHFFTVQECTSCRCFRIVKFVFVKATFGIDQLTNSLLAYLIKITFVFSKESKIKPWDWVLYKTSIYWIVCHEHSLLYSNLSAETIERESELFMNVNKETCKEEEDKIKENAIRCQMSVTQIFTMQYVQIRYYMRDCIECDCVAMR